MAALIRAHRNPVHILLNRSRDDLVDRTIVAQMHDLDAHRLQDAPHDVDRCIMTIKQCGRRHEPNPVLRWIAGLRSILKLIRHGNVS